MCFGRERNAKRVGLGECDVAYGLIKIAELGGVQAGKSQNEALGRFSPTEARKGAPFMIRIAAERQFTKLLELRRGETSNDTS